MACSIGILEYFNTGKKTEDKHIASQSVATGEIERYYNWAISLVTTVVPKVKVGTECQYQ